MSKKNTLDRSSSKVDNLKKTRYVMSLIFFNMDTYILRREWGKMRHLFLPKKIYFCKCLQSLEKILVVRLNIENITKLWGKIFFWLYYLNYFITNRQKLLLFPDQDSNSDTFCYAPVINFFLYGSLEKWDISF